MSTRRAATGLLTGHLTARPTTRTADEDDA